MLRILASRCSRATRGRAFFSSQVPETSNDVISLTFIDAEGESTVVQAKVGETLLDIAHENDIEIEGACGGELACSTCHCILEPQVYAKLEPPTEEEEDMLDLAWGLTDTSRLGCQIKATKELEGILIRIPDESNDMS